MFALAWVLLAATPAQWVGPPPPARATRVITLAPSLTETVLALGAKDALVGVSRFCEFPEVAALPRAGGFNDIAVETVVTLKPDLVVVQMAPGNQKGAETLGRLGISVLALPLTTIDDITSAFVELGKRLGHEDTAATLVNDLAEARKDARAHRPKHAKRTLFVYGFAPLVVAGPGSFADELLRDCGAANVAAKAPTAYPTYSTERVVALTPELIVDAADVADGKAPLQALAPLKKAAWVSLPSKDLLHPGPALAKALPALCALVR